MHIAYKMHTQCIHSVYTEYTQCKCSNRTSCCFLPSFLPLPSYTSAIPCRLLTYHGVYMIYNYFNYYQYLNTRILTSGGFMTSCKHRLSYLTSKSSLHSVPVLFFLCANVTDQKVTLSEIRKILSFINFQSLDYPVFVPNLCRL